MISFNFIPGDVRVPGTYVEYDASKALSGLPVVQQRILLIGQMLNTGTAAPLTPVRITSKDEAIAAFGRGSLAAIAFAALKAVNDRTESWGIGLSDAAGATKASGTITVAGPATRAGTIALYVDGQRLTIGVADAASADTMATAIAASINAYADLPITAAAAAAVVTLTARNGGTAGNDIDVRHSFQTGEALPSGTGLTITPMAGGATDPTLDAVWAAVGDQPFQTIILPTDTAAVLSAAETEMASRAGPLRMIEGVAYAASRATLGQALASGALRNSQYSSILPVKGSPAHPVRWVAAYAGVIAYHAAIDPARPFQTLALAGLLAPAIGDRFTAAEREQLLRTGMSTFTTGADGTVAIERAITTYQVNAQDLPDVAWLDVNTPLTLAFIRDAVRQRIATRFPRHKLADDGVNYAAGQAIVTPSAIRGELVALFMDLADAGIVENLAQFKQDLIVERDKADRNRVNALIPPDIVNQFRVFAARVEFRL